MANLRVDKITSTETFETTGSVQFGNDNALKISANSGFDLTSNDFTMESWIYMNSVESFQTILMYTVDGTEDDTSFQFDITSTQLRFVAYVSNSSEVYGSNFSFGSDTWYHVAATRTNGLVRLFVDGDSEIKSSLVFNADNKDKESSGFCLCLSKLRLLQLG